MKGILVTMVMPICHLYAHSRQSSIMELALCICGLNFLKVAVVVLQSTSVP